MVAYKAISRKGVWISDSAIADSIKACYAIGMKKEKPKPVIVRLYKSQRKTLSRLAKKSKVSQAGVVRYAIDQLVIQEVEKV